MVENTYREVTPSLSWSINNVTSISFSVAEYNGNEILTWVVIDSTSGLLKVSAPSVPANSTFYFSINSSVNGVSNPFQNLVTVQVSKWTVQDWERCKSSDGTVWEVYKSPSGAAEALRTTSQSIVGAIAITTTVSALLNASSMSSFWLTVNQIQLYFLLLIAGAYIPVDVQTVIIGIKFVLFPFNLTPLRQMGLIDSIMQRFDFESSNSNLDRIEMDSDSTVFNISSSIFFIWYAIMIHIWIAVLKKVMQLWREHGRYAKLIRCTKRVLNKIFEILTFGYYIRSMLEINQFALISSINEIYLFNTSQRYRIPSLVFAFIVLIGCILLIVFVLFLSLINKRQDKEKLNQSEEFFSGLKVLKKSRLYVWILMWRRVVYVLLIITLVSTSSIAIIITLASLQIF